VAGKLGGRKPSRGWETLKAERAGVGIPGRAYLRACVVVGASNPRKVAGAAQDSGGGGSECPEGEPKITGAPGAEAPGGVPPEDRVAVETAWREP